jgi:N-acetylglucosamine kinase-like BadF-type ATPase
MCGCVIGVDGGGSNTICVVLDPENREIARARSGPSNHQSVGEETTRKNVAEAVRLALEQAGNPPIAAACMGMAGLDWPEDHVILGRVADAVFGETPRLATHDATIALVGGTGGERYGVVIISGTGSIAVGFNREGREVRASGWGYLLGDEGSAYGIAVQGLKAAARAHDGRTPPTVLTGRLPAAVGADSMENMASRLYLDEWDVPAIASLAPVVTQAAAEGDAAAVGVVRWAGEELALAARAVIARLGMREESFEVILIGSVLKAGGLIVDILRESLAEIAPKANVIYPRHDPAVGAALMARTLIEKTP